MRSVKMVLSILLVIAVLASSSLPVYSSGDTSADSETTVSDCTTFTKATLDQEFSGDSLLVILDSETSAINKAHGTDFFASIEIENIVDLTAISDYDTKKETDRFISQIEEEAFCQILKIELPIDSKENVLAVIEKLKNIEGIIYAEPNYYYTTNSVEPDDESYEFQWNLRTIGCPDAWEITTGSANVRVGVIDSGIASHLDLVDNLVDGWDFANGNANTSDDPTGHGTSVAGIIGASADNSMGISGVVWNVSLVPLQTVNGEGKHEVADVIAAISYATNNNIPILNCSMSSPNASMALLQEIANYPGLFVCSAGNSNANLDTNPEYPACFDCPNLISVGASDNNSLRYAKSNYSDKFLDLAAPGVGIITTTVEDYDRRDGTSGAAPHVTGVAALIYSIRPDLCAKEIKNLILSNVDQNSNWDELCSTGGILNAYKAVRAATEPQTFTGDVNGDGRSDMILSRRINGKRAITTYLGQSNGSFGNPITTQSTRNFVYTDPAFVGDFNGDGLTDMVVHWSNNNYRQLLVYISKGNGQFNEGVNLSSTRFHDPDQLPCKFFVADVNGDGCDDFVVHYRNTSGKRCMLVYQGKATSPYFVDATTDALVSTNTYYYNDPVYMGDFNGDGCADMLVQWIGDNYKRQLLVYKGNADGTFSAGTNLASTKYHKMGAYPSQFAITDVNDDGMDDFVVHWRNDAGKRCNLVYKGKSASPYLTDATTDALVSTNNYVVDDPIFVGDFNGDGRSDMLVHWENNGYRQLLVYIANASGSYNAAIRCSTSNKHDPIKYAGSFYVADVNGDGKDDFIVKWREELSIRFLTYLGTSSGEFGSAVRTVPNTDILYYNAA